MQQGQEQQTPQQAPQGTQQRQQYSSHQYTPQQYFPQGNQQQTVIFINQQPKDDNMVMAGFAGCCLGFCGIIPLCCFKSSKAQAVICLASGAGGLAAASTWFVNYSLWNTRSWKAENYYEYNLSTRDYSYRVGTVHDHDSLASTAMLFLILGIIYLVIDIILLSVGGYNLNKANNAPQVQVVTSASAPVAITAAVSPEKQYQQ